MREQAWADGKLRHRVPSERSLSFGRRASEKVVHED